MMARQASVARPRRRSSLGVLAYLAAVAALIGVVWLAATGLQHRFAQLSAAQDLLARLEAAGRPAAPSGKEGGMPVSGSPFLDGQTVTLAEAALQQRVVSAVTAAGGNVLSSQIEPGGSDAKKDFLTLIASCEIDQQGLQPLLYDLEAGMPFLYIDQLVLQAPQAVSGSEGGRLRLLISVSGRWQGTK
jgi:general secretion pathway protein M